MEFILNRYRNLTVLLIVVTAQLLLIAYQVRTTKDVPLVRVWAVTAVTPVERILEFGRRNTWGFVEDYFFLLNTRQQNEQLQKQVGELKLENQFLKTQLSTADRTKALGQFQAQSPSKMIAGRIIGNGTGANSKAVFVDRGSGDGVESGMAVITPDGIVGKVIAAYPTASLVLLITDANFAAGVISQKNRVHGTLKGQGHDGTVEVDYVQAEEKVEVGEWFYTSGDDRIFPKGFPVGQTTAVRNGRNLKEIYVTPSGFQNGLEEVLIVIDGVHQPIPEAEIASPGINLTPAPPLAEGSEAPAQTPSITTDADRLKEQYRQAADAQHHTFGEGLPGSTPPDFTKLPGIRENGSQSAGKPPSQPLTTPSGAQPTAPQTAGKPAAIPTGGAAGTARVAGPVSAETAGAVPVKPKPKAPLLVTDPTDANPDEPATTPPLRRSDANLDEFGQPKARPTPKKKPAADANTEILPPAPAPKPKSNVP
jgi:rod shape-determining protein MreC